MKSGTFNTVHSESSRSEMMLLLSALQVAGRKNSEKDLSIEMDVNFSATANLAVKHGVFPLFYRFWRQMAGLDGTTKPASMYKNAYLTNVARNLQLTNSMIDILDRMLRRGITAIPFKGPVIAARAYRDVGLRSFCDLDILIRPQDFANVYDVMEGAGLQSVKPMIRRVKTMWQRMRRNFEFQSENLIIDFHQQVTTGPRFLQLEVQWDNLSSVELMGRKVPCLCLEDSILMLAMHGTHHGWNLLKYVADLAHLVSRHQDVIQWENLVRKARRMGILRMVSVGISLGHDFCGLAVPPRIQEEIVKDRKVGKLAVYFKIKVMEPEKSGLIPQTSLPRSLDTRRHQLRYLGYYMFTPTNLDVLSIRLPVILYPLYFIIRPFRLLSNLVRGREIS